MKISLQKSKQLQAIAILMMLCLHLFNRDYHGLFRPLIFIGKQPLSYYISLFCDACVPIFAFVSGYGLYFKFVNSRKTYRIDNLKRLKKLYINYWIILILFAVLLGWVLGKEGYPGGFQKFLLNFLGLNNSYNGAWWFFTIYLFFVLTSGFWFLLLDKLNPYLFLCILGILYIVAFYFRVYNKTGIFSHDLIWFHKQLALYFCTLFQFMLGAFALKYDWNRLASKVFARIHYKNAAALLFIILLIIFHSIVPNFIIAPITGLVFILLFLQLNIGEAGNRILDYFTPHYTNLWLIHMFLYMIYFHHFVYGFRYVPLIFLVLIILCLMCSYIVNFLNKKVQNLI